MLTVWVIGKNGRNDSKLETVDWTTAGKWPVPPGAIKKTSAPPSVHWLSGKSAKTHNLGFHFLLSGFLFTQNQHHQTFNATSFLRLNFKTHLRTTPAAHSPPSACLFTRRALSAPLPPVSFPPPRLSCRVYLSTRRKTPPGRTTLRSSLVLFSSEFFFLPLPRLLLARGTESILMQDSMELTGVTPAVRCVGRACAASQRKSRCDAWR